MAAVRSESEVHAHPFHARTIKIKNWRDSSLANRFKDAEAKTPLHCSVEDERSERGD